MEPEAVAVLDLGKTNVKLDAATPDGAILETLSTPNPVRPGPPYRHHDLGALEEWVLDGLAALGRRHRLGAVVACAHGSGGVLVGADGPAMPMIDYEQDTPPAVDAAYRALVGPYRERGSPVMLGATHLARQLLWLETEWPDEVRRAGWLLPLPQYWAWRLCGIAAMDVTSLGAQSHLWDAEHGRPAAIVAARGWERLLPPLVPSWQALGPPRPDVARRTGLRPGTRVLCGVHDSSVNFYRYQAAGLRDLAVVSTGTWIVALTDRFDGTRLDEARNMTCNAGVDGRPLAGALTMGGREFSAVAGPSPGDGPARADADAVRRLVGAGCSALPSFGDDDGLFPGSARRGRMVGPAPDGAGERLALGVLYTALLTVACLDALGHDGPVVLDGSYVEDPLYPALVAALRPGRPTHCNAQTRGAAAGAALLAGHATRAAPAPLALRPAEPLDCPGLPGYAARWRDLTREAMRTTP